MSPRPNFIVVYIAAAVVSAAAMHTLDIYGLVNGRPDAVPELDEAALLELQPSLIETGSISMGEEPPVAAPPRLAFVSPDALALRSELLVDDPVAEDMQDWSTEFHEEPGLTSKQLTAPNGSETLPWLKKQLFAAGQQHSLKQKLAQIGPAATMRLEEKFKTANVAWPPAGAALVAIKDKKSLELHARSKNGAWTFIHSYPVRAASGKSGPKLTQGDKQVPEGVYGISFLNPNSRYHVALRVNYPNAFDREMAKKDGRKKLGGDIMIHGKASSAGCLAMGDEAAEELFVLAAQVGLPNVKVVIAPTDFRSDGLPKPAPDEPAWLPGLYSQLSVALADFKAPPANPVTGLLSFFGN